MAKAIKTPSGKWKCTVFLGKDSNGKQIRKCFTAPTKAEAEEMAKHCELTQKKEIHVEKEMTVADAVERFIIKKESEFEKGKISPTTITGYKSYQKNAIDEIKDVPVLKITDTMLNSWIESLNEKHSPKYCKNAYSLIRASLMDVLPRSTVIDWRITLPTISKRKVNVPTEERIGELLKYLKENDYDMYIACLLASFGTMRRSELCALTVDDVKGNVITINKAMVRDENGIWHIKGTKTEMSTRDVLMPPFVIQALPKQGKLVNITPSRVSDRFIKYLKRLNIRTFTFHDLRHYSASIMHELGASDETIMSRGGWSNAQTLDTHYRGSMTEYEKAFTDKLNKHFEEKFG